MIKKLTDLTIRMTKALYLIIFIVAFAGIEFAFNAWMPAFSELSGGPLLDMSPGHNAAFAYERLNSFGAAAGLYFRIRTLDFFFPVVYAFGISILSSFVYRKKYDNPDNYRWVLAVPFSAAVFDYIENIMLVILYRALPAEFPAAASILNIITILKFGLIGLSILLIITGALALLKGGDSMLIRGNSFRGENKKADSSKEKKD